MKKQILVALTAAAVFTFQSCRKTAGDGPSITKTYSLSGFTGIDAGIDGDVYYTQDSVYKVEITGQANILDKIETPIVNGELRLQFKKFGHIGRHDRLVARISAPSVTSLGVNGPGNVYANNGVSSKNMNLRVNGSGNLYVASCMGNDLTGNISGSGRITVNGGKVYTENLRISGSGDIDLMNLEAENVSTNTSGSGNTSVYATKTLDIKISGSGNVYYRGNPSVNTSISGSGKVSHQ